MCPHPIAKSNVLIDNNGHAGQTKFGPLTVISDDPTVVSTAVRAMAAYWISPELLFPERFDLKESRPTKASDCYALGMMTCEVLSGQAPFGQHPPVISIGSWMENAQRDIKECKRHGSQMAYGGTLELCWKPQACNRVGAKAVLWGLEENSPLLGPSSNGGEGVEIHADYQSDAVSGGLSVFSPLHFRLVLNALPLRRILDWIQR